MKNMPPKLRAYLKHCGLSHNGSARTIIKRLVKSGRLSPQGRMTHKEANQLLTVFSENISIPDALAKIKSRSAFYKSWEWKAARYEALKLHGRKCMCCGATERVVVDHIMPVSKYPQLALDVNNLQVLCDACNRGKSNRDMTDWRKAADAPDHDAEILSMLQWHGII